MRENDIRRLTCDGCGIDAPEHVTGAPPNLEHQPQVAQHPRTSKLMSVLRGRRLKIGSLLAGAAVLVGGYIARHSGEKVDVSPQLNQLNGIDNAVDSDDVLLSEIDDILVDGLTLKHEGQGVKSIAELFREILQSLEKIGFPAYELQEIKSLIQEYERTKDSETLDKIEKLIDKLMDELDEILEEEEYQRIRRMIKQLA